MHSSSSGRRDEPSYVIDVAVSPPRFAARIDRKRLKQAVADVLQAEGVASAEISIAVVDDRTIRDLNRRHLDQDDATDVLSFRLDGGEGRLEGEVIVSAETAAASAPRYGWGPAEELLLYVVHGVLHLTGYEDGTAAERAAMRREERRHLSRYGLTPRYDEEGAPGAAASGPMGGAAGASEGDGSE